MHARFQRFITGYHRVGMVRGSRPRSCRGWLRRAAVLVLFVLASLGAFGPGTSAAPYQPPEFEGTVRIAGQPADPGTVVQVALFRAGQTYTVCADTTVQLLNTGLPGVRGQVAAYIASLSPTPQCLNPDTVYEFFVNGVNAGISPNRFSPSVQLDYVNLTVPEVALETEKTKTQGGVRLVWLYGRVTDEFGRPAPAGTNVTAEAQGASCRGTGTVQDLYWVPKFPNSRTVGVLGFYWIGVEATSDCVDRLVVFNIYASSPPARGTLVPVVTTPRAKAVQGNVVLP